MDKLYYPNKALTQLYDFLMSKTSLGKVKTYLGKRNMTLKSRCISKVWHFVIIFRKKCRIFLVF